jgi:hypothetical protein
MGGGGALFLWIAGSTVTLIMDDVNLAYITVLFIISIDEINKKENFTIDNLEKCDDGSLKVVINTDARESKQGKKKDKKGKEKKKKGKKSKDKAEPQPTPEIAEVESKSDKKKNKKKKK